MESAEKEEAEGEMMGMKADWTVGERAETLAGSAYLSLFLHCKGQFLTTSYWKHRLMLLSLLESLALEQEKYTYNVLQWDMCIYQLCIL